MKGDLAMAFVIPMLRSARSLLIELASKHHPYESGGIVVQYQDNGFVRQEVCLVPNVHSRPEHNYSGETQATIEAYELANDYVDLGGHIAFCWHSHPSGPAEPSEVDDNHFHVSGNLVIVSLSDLQQPTIEAFRMSSGSHVKAEILEL